MVFPRAVRHADMLRLILGGYSRAPLENFYIFRALIIF